MWKTLKKQKKYVKKQHRSIWNPGTIRDGSICRTGRLRKNQRQVISGRPCSLGTIAKKSETGYLWQTLQLGEGYQGEAKLEVEAGTYRVITTNRLPNGNLFAACTEFDFENGQTIEIQLTLRKAELKDMLEEIPLEEFAVEDEQGTKILGSQKVKEGTSLFRAEGYAGRDSAGRICGRR